MFTDYIENSFIQKLENNSAIFPRFRYAFSTPAYALGAIVDTILTTCVVGANLCTLGLIEPLNNKACVRSDDNRQLVSTVYITALRVLNPKATIKENCAISSEGDGFISNFTTEPLKNLALDYAVHLTAPTSVFDTSKELSWIDRNIKSRALHALGFVVSPFVRLADLAVAVVAVPLSFLTYGRITSINNLAYRSLQTPGLLRDLNHFGTHFINPKMSGDVRIQFTG